MDIHYLKNLFCSLKFRFASCSRLVIGWVYLYRRWYGTLKLLILQYVWWQLVDFFRKLFYILNTMFNYLLHASHWNFDCGIYQSIKKCQTFVVFAHFCIENEEMQYRAVFLDQVWLDRVLSNYFSRIIVSYRNEKKHLFPFQNLKNLETVIFSANIARSCFKVWQWLSLSVTKVNRCWWRK